MRYEGVEVIAFHEGGRMEWIWTTPHTWRHRAGRRIGPVLRRLAAWLVERSERMQPLLTSCNCELRPIRREWRDT